MPQPYEKLPLETKHAFESFKIYADLGPKRTIKAAIEKIGKWKRMIPTWHDKHCWAERAAEMDSRQAAIDEAKETALREGKGSEWIKRQRQLRQSEWELSEQCIAAARKGLNEFLKREKIFIDLSHIARLLELASKLGRLATGMPTDKTEISGDEGGPIRVEITAALNKIYGSQEPAIEIETKVENEHESPRAIL